MEPSLRQIFILLLLGILLLAYIPPSETLPKNNGQTLLGVATSTQSISLDLYATTTEIATTSTPTPRPKITNPVTKKPTPPKSTAQETPLDIPLSISTTPSIPPPNPSELNLRTRETVVNILCVTKQSGSFEPISGSGVIIDSRGIILTNAHVAQYFLLKDFQVPNFIDCTIRTGSPASPTYRAALIYISPRWISDNAPKIKLSRSLGTGEHDYAFLRITGRVDGKALPQSFTASIPDVNFNSIPEENSALLVSYPAELLGGILTQTSLNQVSSIASIKEGFFFPGNNESTLDTFSLGGNIVAQGGSSGGAVVNSADGKLIGILVTSTAAESTDSKNLRGLSLSHINRSIREEIGVSLASFLEEDPRIIQSDFDQNLFQPLKKILEDTIRGISTSQSAAVVH